MSRAYPICNSGRHGSIGEITLSSKYVFSYLQ
jgi:hypothetical protein